MPKNFKSCSKHLRPLSFICHTLSGSPDGLYQTCAWNYAPFTYWLQFQVLVLKSNVK